MFLLSYCSLIENGKKGENGKGRGGVEKKDKTDVLYLFNRFQQCFLSIFLRRYKLRTMEKKEDIKNSHLNTNLDVSLVLQLLDE